nr:reverse transcriptase domain-containing protein [Tanacetum cinerariifolium]
MKDQHLPADASSTALSPGYIADFDLEEDLEKDSADYPAVGGDNYDNESSDDDNDDDDETMTTVNQGMSVEEIERVAVIVCDEKIIRVPIRNETLIIRSNESNRVNESRFNIISCTETQKYMLKGCQVFLAHATTRDTEDKSKEKRLEVMLNHSEFSRGLAGYYRKFIEGFSKIAKSMTKLTQKRVKFNWGDKQEAVFQLLKQKLGSAPILALLEGNKDFVVYCDASHKGLGAVLMQREKRHYLYGTKCTMFTDHKSLQHILNIKKWNMRQRRWLELLSCYDCEILYHPGKANVIADALSRKEQIKPLRV